MINEKILLSICIPTYNREKYLDITLANIIDQIEKVDYKIELIVSDNNSSDHTKEVVKKYQNNKCLIYSANKKNLGFDGNFKKCFELATGKYVWLLSDDDYLLPDALLNIKNTLNKDPVCVHINSCGMNRRGNFEIKNKRIKENNTLEYINKNEYLKKIGIYCTFISANIYKNIYIKKIKNIDRFFETNILHSFVLIETMRNKGIYIIDPNVCVVERENLKVSYDVLDTWIKSYKELLLNHATECGFSKKVMLDIFNKNLKNEILNIIIHFKINGVNVDEWDKKILDNCLKEYNNVRRLYKTIIKCPIFIVYLLKCWHKIVWIITK